MYMGMGLMVREDQYFLMVSKMLWFGSDGFLLGGK